MGNSSNGNVSAFDVAWKFTSKWEGGYSNHPNDPGGSTNYGITQTTLNAYNNMLGLPWQHVRDLSPEVAVEIAEIMYWDKMGLDKVSVDSPMLAIALFDWGFHSGPENVLNRTRDATTASEVLDLRVQFLTGLEGFNSFGRGWIRRVEDLRKLIESAPVRKPVEVVQIFNGSELVGSFRPVATSFGTTNSGNTKIMVRLA